MPFNPKNEALLGEQYKLMDELVDLGLERQSLELRLEKVRDRIRAARLRNQEICWQLSPERERGNVTRVDFMNRIRFKSNSSSYEQAA